MQTTPIIRPANAADARDLAVFAESTFRAAFQESNAAGNMDRHCAANFSEELQLAEIRDTDRETWLAKADGHLVGYIQLRIDARTACVDGRKPIEIQRLYLDPSRHGTGLAHELMRLVIAWSESRGADVVWLGVWERNPKAIAFYRKWGFEVVGEHVFRLGDDPQRDLIMRRNLQTTR